MRRARLAAIVAVAGLAACAQEPPRADPKAPSVAAGPLAGFGWFAELAGSCWSGTRSDQVTVDTQCYLPQYQRLMRGSFKAEVAGNVVFEGDAVFAVDPEGSGKVVYTQWGTDGGYATGEMKVDGDTLVFHSRNVDGSEWLVRHVWRRTGPDGYRVTRERKEDTKWAEAFSIEYRRIPGR